MMLNFTRNSSIELKTERLHSIPEVENTYQEIRSRFPQLPSRYEWIVKQLIAIGQFKMPATYDAARFELFAEKLIQIDSFYEEIGGLIGYQRRILALLEQKPKEEENVSYYPPSFIDISEESKEVWQNIYSGIEAIPLLAEMIPLGGAADRLHLVDEVTGIELPAAKLPFAGLPLLATILRDLQAREYLYYKLYGKQVITPLALMTSEEKENHKHIVGLLTEYGWFGRPKESIRLFMQPLVPVVDEEGNWCWLGPFKPLMKPGGHGAIWKLARDWGIFDWFFAHKRTKTLIRQINNPIAGIDYGLLSFAGIGVMRDMSFGFASCPRQLNAAEGVNVLLEKIMNGKKALVLTNVEYCDFAKAKIDHLLQKENSLFSSNTNILFADLEALTKAVEVCPYPGLLINLKKIGYTTETGQRIEKPLARLESTMQNIADAFIEEKKDKLNTENTFVTYNHRRKTISTAKKAYVPGSSLQETPEKCFYDLLLANRELLESRCGWVLPARQSLEEYLLQGPESLFLYHPALGPLYAIISQKMRKGRCSLGSELQLEIADLDLEELDLNGSLLVRAEQIMGHFDPLLQYSNQTGRCTLKNVTIRNRGVNWAASSPFWKNCYVRHESMQIILKGHSEFIAENILFSGNHCFVVEDKMRMRVSMENGKFVIEKKPIQEIEGPFWNYEKRSKIVLSKGFAKK